MIGLLLLFSTLPLHGVNDYYSCVMATVRLRDDNRSDPDDIVSIAKSVCLKEDLAMQAEYRDQIADNLQYRKPVIQHLHAVASELAEPAAQAMRKVVRDLAIAHIRYNRSARRGE
jgi:hypothetical protein